MGCVSSQPREPEKINQETPSDGLQIDSQSCQNIEYDQTGIQDFVAQQSVDASASSDPASGGSSIPTANAASDTSSNQPSISAAADPADNVAPNQIASDGDVSEDPILADNSNPSSINQTSTTSNILPSTDTNNSTNHIKPISSVSGVLYLMKVVDRGVSYAGHNVRDSPTLTAQSLLQIQTGDVVFVLEERLRWVRIALPDGRFADQQLWTVTVFNNVTCLERIIQGPDSGPLIITSSGGTDLASSQKLVPAKKSSSKIVQPKQVFSAPEEPPPQDPAQYQKEFCNGHTKTVRAFAFNPEGNILYSGALDNSAKMWDTEKMSCIQTFSGGLGLVWAVALTHDGRYLLTGDDKYFVNKWSITTGTMIRDLGKMQAAVVSIEITKDDSTFVCVDGNDVSSFNLANGQRVHTFRGHTRPSFTLCLSHDDNYVFTGAYDGDVRIWTFNDGSNLHLCKGHSAPVMASCHTKHSSILCTGSEDKKIILWNTWDGSQHMVLEGHENTVRCLALTKDDAYLFSTSYDENIKIWDMATGDCLVTLEGHAGKVCCCMLSQDDNTLWTGGDDMVKRWDYPIEDDLNYYLRILDGVFEDYFPQSVYQEIAVLCVTPYPLSMKERQYVNNGHVIRKRVHSDLVRTLALNAGSGALYSGSLDKTAKIWDVKDMRPTRTMADSGVGSIWAVAVTHDNRYLLTGDNAKNVKKWDVQTGDCIKTYEKMGDSVVAIVITQDDSVFACVSYNDSVSFDIITGDEINRFTGHSRQTFTLTLSQDDQFLYSGAYDNDVCIFDFNNGSRLFCCKGHTAPVMASCVTSDNSILCTGGEDNKIILWDAFTGQQKLTLVGHKGTVRSLCLTLGDKYLISASYDKTIKLWDMTTKDCLATLTGHVDKVCCCVISPDMKWLFSGSKTVKRWDMEKFLKLPDDEIIDGGDGSGAA